MKTIFFSLLMLISFFCHATETPISLVEINNHWNKFIKIKEYDGNFQTPEITYKNKTGSSEDIAIIKYFDLIAHGIPEGKLKIAIVSKNDKKTDAVLIFIHKNKKMVLDSEKSEILELKDRKDIKKITSIVTRAGVFVPNIGFNDQTFKWASIRNDFDEHVLFLKKLPKKLEKSAVHG